MAEHHDLPFRAEYAKSNRASCKGCSGLISKDSLRLAIMIQSSMFDGKVPNWYHFKCFWKKARVPTCTDIHGYDCLRWDDQEKVKEKIASGEGGGGDGPVGEYTAEYAKSNRSTCRGCDSKIDKDELRLSKKEFDSQRAKRYGPQDLWHHVDCFVEKREELGFGKGMDPTTIKGYNSVTSDDKEMLLKKLGKGESKSKKRKSEAADVALKKQKTETEEEKALKEQSKLLWKYRDALQKEVANDALKGLLEYNKQDLASGESKLLDRVSDAMVFGALQPCSECGGQLTYSHGGYRCTGNLTEWTKCVNCTTTPKRKAFKIPEEYHDVDIFKKYKYVKRNRVFPAELQASASASQSLDGAASAPSGGPLAGMTFAIVGKTSKSKIQINKDVVALGGKVVSKIDKTVTACISTTSEVEKMSKGVKDAKKHDVHVVEEAYLDAVSKGGALLLIEQHSVCDWGSDPADRVKDTVDGPAPGKSYGKSLVHTKKDEDMFTKSVPTTMKMTVKGGAAVDPESGLEDRAHVLKERGDLYTVVLGLVDIVRGTNSYYKLQLLESDKNNKWWVFRAWGRVGTTIGGNKLENCGSKSSALSTFKAVYADKTGNEWEDRSNFTKYPNKFYPIDIDHGTEDAKVKQLDRSAGSTSKLPASVQDVIRMIFDIESMKRAMLEYEIDLKKMPLGKLSRKQIENAYKVLTELQQLIQNGGSETRFLDASNRFYILIPHDFGMRKPPLMNSAELIKAKVEMLDNLLDIELAYSLLEGGEQAGEDPIDTHYKKLNTGMTPMDKTSEEYGRLQDYVKNTHAATHNQYDLEVLDIFKIERQGEKKRFRPFRDLHNRQLLWHGSRTTNYAGILSQGLRIAPPEAPVTGYMFGKGVYFADMVSKSANYCRTSKTDPIGLMLLCEVALGNMYELTGAQYVTNLPKGMHSTKGCGMTEPNPSAAYTAPDGLVIPMGEGMPATGKNRSNLLYNEYIVYDVAQIQCQYMFKLDFKFRW